MELTFREDRSVTTSEGHRGHWFAGADMIDISWEFDDHTSLGRTYVVAPDRRSYHRERDENVRGERVTDDD